MGIVPILIASAAGTSPSLSHAQNGAAADGAGAAQPAGGHAVPSVASAVQQQIEQLKAQECVLLGEFGDFGWWLQGALGLLSFSTLLLKHYMEERTGRRPFKVFLFDAVKQACGSGALHLMNLACASLFASCTRQAADPCEWYWLNIMLDTTLGVYLLKLLLDVSRRSFKLEGLNAFGFYGDPPQWSACWLQVLVWLALVATMKLTMIMTMMIAQLPLSSLASAVLNSLDDSPRLKLLVVMIITPFTMNTLQYWVTDNILKRTRGDAGFGDYPCPEWTPTHRGGTPRTSYELVRQLDVTPSAQREGLTSAPTSQDAETARDQNADNRI